MTRTALPEGNASATLASIMGQLCGSESKRPLLVMLDMSVIIRSAELERPLP